MEAVRRTRRALRCAVLAVAILAASGALACVTRPAPPVRTAAIDAELRRGLDLYEARDYERAALAFRSAAERARYGGSRVQRANARTAECTAWLRAARPDELALCTARLEPLLERHRRPDGGLETLVALGALAGNREPELRRLSGASRALVRQAQSEGAK